MSTLELYRSKSPAQAAKWFSQDELGLGGIRIRQSLQGKNIMYNQLFLLSHCHRVCLPAYTVHLHVDHAMSGVGFHCHRVCLPAYTVHLHVDHAMSGVGFHCAAGGSSMQASCDGRRLITVTRLRLRQPPHVLFYNERANKHTK